MRALARLGWMGLIFAMACGGDDTGAASGSADATDTDGSTSSETSSGVGTEGTESEGEPMFCEGPTVLRYAPLDAVLDAFPDDFFTLDDDGPTGVRVDLRPGENLVLEGNAAAFASVFEDASTLDGWGTTSEIWVQIDGSIDPASLPAVADQPHPENSVVVVDLDADPLRLIPIRPRLVAEGNGESRTTLLLEPLVPLQPAHRHGVAVTNRVTDAAGGCVAPSPTMRSLLEHSATDSSLQRLYSRIDELVDALVELGTIADVRELTAGLVFTTQTTVDDSMFIAQEIAATAPPTYVPDETPCTDPDPEGAFLVCEGSFEAMDYTTADEALAEDLSVQGSYVLPMVAYLPKTGAAPHPVLVYGHGLTGDRYQAEALAELAAPLGFATVAIDAPKHGAHPDSGGVIQFFGLSLDLSNPMNALQLRDNFRQGTYDRLQLVQMLLSGVDLDGDRSVDLDGQRLHYLGVSLGGIMGPELLALAPEFRTAILIVPGARVTGIVAEGEQFAIVVDIFASMATDGEIARFFPVLQSVVDRGDAGVYAPHVVQQRLEGFGDRGPQLLMQMVLDDDTVPNTTNAFLASALGVPHVGPVLRKIGVIAEEPELPTHDNVGRGQTAGVFQFDIVEDGEAATHGNIARSEVGSTQALHFLDSFVSTGTAEILDPYVELGIK